MSFNSSLVSSYNTLENDESKFEALKEAALAGDINASVPSLNRSLNIPFFISSAFTSVENRSDIKKIKVVHETIKRIVKRQIEIFIQAKGYTLDVVDMKWAMIHKPVETDPCYDELKMAIELSDSPFLFVLLGEVCERTYAPNQIDSDDMDKFRAECNDKETFEKLFKWYELDENNIPNEYILKGAESKTTNEATNNYSNKAERNRFEKEKIDANALESFYEICGGHKKEFRKFLDNLKYNEKDSENITNKYNVMEYTLENFLIENSIKMNFHFLFFMKVDLNDEYLFYLSKLFLVLQIDNDQNELLSSNFEDDSNKIEKLIKKFKYKYKQPLSAKLINDNIESEQFVKFSQDFINNVQFFLEIYKEKHTRFVNALKDYMELLHHIKFGKNKLNSFVGRETLLKTAFDAIKNTQYCAFYGESGSGKTSVLSRIASGIKKLSGNENAIILIRYIGTSEDSFNIQTILKSIIYQLEQKLNIDANSENKIKVEQEKLSPIDNLYNYFKQFLYNAALKNSKKNFFLILDSLDQLNDDYNAKLLEWFPNDLPSNFKVIVSTLKEEEFKVYPVLAKGLHTREAMKLIEIELLEESDIRKMFLDRCKHANKELRDEQNEFLLNIFRNYRTPLFVKICTDEALKWKSFTNINNDTEFPLSVDEAVRFIFNKIEKQFERDFVMRVLKYITLSKYGLDMNQLVRVLSFDAKLLDFITRHFGFNVDDSQISQLGMMQLLFSLREYLSGPRYHWYHRKFDLNANERYCDTIIEKEDNKSCYKLIADNFAQYKFSDLFWIRVLPYFATKSENLKCVKNEYLLNLEFMEKKIEVTDVDELLNDFEFAFKIIDKDRDDVKTLEIIYHTLVSAASCIRSSPAQLAGQLLGRLYQVDTSHTPEIAEIIRKCKTTFDTNLIPDKRFLSESSKAENYKYKTVGISELKSISLHDQFLITTSTDNKIKFFLKTDNNDIESETFQFNRKSINTTKLETSNVTNTAYAWSNYSVSDQQKNIVIEAYDIRSKEFKFQFSLSKQEFSNYRSLLLAYDNERNENLCLVTKYILYIINTPYDNEKKVIKVLLPYSIEADEEICSVCANNCLYYAFNNDSKVCVVETPSEDEMFQYRLNDNSEPIFKSDLLSYDLNNKKITGERFVLVDKDKLAISSKKITKCEYQPQYVETEFYISIHDISKLREFKCEKEFSISFEANLYGCGNNKLYATSNDMILIIDIVQERIIRKLQHGSKVNDFYFNSNHEIVTASDNKLYFLSDSNQADDTNEENSINLDELIDIKEYRSQNTLFFYDKYDNGSPLVIVYNLFDNSKHELILIYDLNSNRILRRFRLENVSKNDFVPKAIIDRQYFLFYRKKSSTYILTDIDFNVLDKAKSSAIYTFKYLGSNQFLIGLKSKSNDKLVYFKSLKNNFNVYSPIMIWEKIQWFDINHKNILYKMNDDSVKLCNIDNANTYLIDATEFNSSTKVVTSDDGNYVAVFTKTNDEITGLLNVFELSSILKGGCKASADTKDNINKLKRILTREKCTDVFVFVNRYVVYQVLKDSMFITTIQDLKNIKAKLIEWIKHVDVAESKIIFLKHSTIDKPLTDYLWCERYIENKNAKKFITDINVIDMNNLSVKCSINTDNKLKAGQVELFNNGNAILTKKLNDLDFVTFTVSSMDTPVRIELQASDYFAASSERPISFNDAD